MKELLIVSMLLLPAPFISAQDRPAMAQKVEQVAKQLKLTPDQEVKLLPILRAEAPKVQAIKANTSLSGIQKMEQLKAVHEQTDPQVKSILTPDQYETLKGIRRQEIEQAIRNRQNQR